MYTNLGNQVINISENYDINSSNLNKQLFEIFTPGVLNLTYEINTSPSDHIKITELSCFIKPDNVENSLLKIDIIDDYNIYDLSKDYFLICRLPYRTTEYNYNTENIINILLIQESNININDIILFKLTKPNSLYIADESYQTKCNLNINCINFDTYENDFFKLKNSNSTFINYNELNYTNGNNVDQIPINNGILNSKLNAKYINGISAGNNFENNEYFKIAINNNILNENLIVQYLFQNLNKYEAGNLNSQIPVNNGIVNVNLNSEFLNSKNIDQFSLLTHTHTLDEIYDDSTYQKIISIDENNLLTNNSLNNNCFEYKHQDNSFRNDNSTPCNFFIIIGKNGTSDNKEITFIKPFSSTPRVFICNNRNNEIKSVYDIKTTGFKINFTYNTIYSNVQGLIQNDENFSFDWMAIGEI